MMTYYNKKLSLRIINGSRKSLLLMNISNVVPFMNKVEKQAKVNYGPWCYTSDDL